MSAVVHIRRYQEGEEPSLFEIYYSAIHLVACQNYTPEQLNAWAPRDLDAELWRSRIRGISPFGAELKGQIVGYADLQQNGYIDHSVSSTLCATAYQRALQGGQRGLDKSIVVQITTCPWHIRCKYRGNSKASRACKR